MCWPLLLCPFGIFECLNSKQESCRSKQASYQFSQPLPFAPHLPPYNCTVLYTKKSRLNIRYVRTRVLNYIFSCLTAICSLLAIELAYSEILGFKNNRYTNPFLEFHVNTTRTFRCIICKNYAVFG